MDACLKGQSTPERERDMAGRNILKDSMILSSFLHCEWQKKTCDERFCANVYRVLDKHAMASKTRLRQASQPIICVSKEEHYTSDSRQKIDHYSFDFFLHWCTRPTIDYATQKPNQRFTTEVCSPPLFCSWRFASHAFLVH